MSPQIIDNHSSVRVAHVITGLGMGGAEAMLVRLVAALDPNVENTVICLSSSGPMADRLRALGVHLTVLDLASGPRALLGLPRLVGALRAARPDLVHTWMYHADLLGGLAAWHCNIPVIWALHNSNLDPARLGRATVSLVHVLARLSHHLPRRIVSCSEFGRQTHEAIGYDPKGLVVIQNGFDCEQFHPDAEHRARARAEWGCGENDLVVGLVARFHPLKDHRTFVRAAGLALRTEPRLRFVLFGDRVTPENAELTSWAQQAGVSSRCSFLGAEPNLERRLPGLDLLVSSSVGEAFPLVIGEAMASGVPCVVTDVGDSALIVGDPARVVPASDPASLGNAIVRTVQLAPERRNAEIAQGMERIRNQFSLAQSASRYAALYREVARGGL